MQRGVGAPFDSAAYSRDLYVGDLESPQRHIPQSAHRQSVSTARSERGAPPCASATDDHAKLLPVVPGRLCETNARVMQKIDQVCCVSAFHVNCRRVSRATCPAMSL